jgi:hypothetical protein
MLNAYKEFEKSIQSTIELGVIYTHLKDCLHLSNDLTDLLRAEWVYTISSMDKLIHELIRIGMIEQFSAKRNKTANFLKFNISMKTHTQITSLMPIPPLPTMPAEYYIEKEIIQRNKLISYQKLDKILEGLGLIWDEQNKSSYLAKIIGISDKDLKTKLTLIVDRRNRIVHEADIDLLTNLKSPICKTDVDDVVTFIKKLSYAIYNSVK